MTSTLSTLCSTGTRCQDSGPIYIEITTSQSGNQFLALKSLGGLLEEQLLEQLHVDLLTSLAVELVLTQDPALITFLQKLPEPLTLRFHSKLYLRHKRSFKVYQTEELI